MSETSEARINVLDTKANYNPTTGAFNASVKVEYTVQANTYKDVPVLDDDGKPTGKTKRIFDRHRVTSIFEAKDTTLVEFTKRAMTQQPLLIKIQGANRGLTAEAAKKALDGKTFSEVPRTRVAVRTPADILAGVMADPELSKELSAEDRKTIEKLLALMKTNS